MSSVDAFPTRLIVMGGFLGAGKTTTLLRLAAHWSSAGKRVGIVTNDQASNLVDSEIFRSAGLDTLEVAGGCFCCHFDDFIARADELLARTQPDVILAEPVGSCTDIVATVLNPLRNLFSTRFRIAPFVVLVDPVRALKVLGGTARVGLSERVTYIYRMQQQEADAIAISKVDLVSESERDRVEQLVREQLPGRDVFSFSARTGEGFDTLLTRLESGGGHRRALADLDYNIYAEGEAELGWLNCRARLHGQQPIVLDDALLRLGGDLCDAFRSRGLEIAHGKILLSGDGQVAVVNMVDSHEPSVLSRQSGALATSMELTINLRVQAEPAALEEIVQKSLASWTARHALSVVDTSVQCFQPPPPVPTHRMVTL